MAPALAELERQMPATSIPCQPVTTRSSGARAEFYSFTNAVPAPIEDERYANAFNNATCGMSYENDSYRNTSPVSQEFTERSGSGR